MRSYGLRAVHCERPAPGLARRDLVDLGSIIDMISNRLVIAVRLVAHSEVTSLGGPRWKSLVSSFRFTDIFCQISHVFIDFCVL